MEAFEVEGFDTGVLSLHLGNTAREALLKQNQGGPSMDEKERVARKLIVIARTILAFASECHMNGFLNTIGRDCDGAIDTKNRAQTIEEIIRCFCLARKHMVARNGGAEHNRSTLTNLFDKLLWLRDNHGRYSRLDTTEYHFLVAAWRDITRCGLVDFMYHDLDNRALIEAYHSSCAGLDKSTVEKLLRILDSTLEEGIVDHRPAPKFLQDPTEACSVAPEAGTRGHKRRRSGSSGASRVRASVPAVQKPTPSVRVVKLESDHGSIAYGVLRTRNRELRKENTDVTAERDGLKARVTVLERLPEEVETLRERDYLNREVIRSKDTVIEALQTTIQAQRETIQNKDDINRNRERDLQEQQAANQELQAANQELHRQFRTQERLVNRLWDSHMLRRE